MVLLLPLVQLVVVVARLQAGSFAVEAGARSAARAAAAAPDPTTGAARAQASVLLALRDQGFDVDPAAASSATRITCPAGPCGDPGTRVVVVVTHEVALPGVPALLDAALPVRVPLTAESSAVVPRFAARAAVPAASPAARLDRAPAAPR